MLTTALRTLRYRYVSFLGSFVALALGVGLIAAMSQVLASSVGTPDRAPQRYAGAPVIVVPDDQLTVPTWQGTDSAPLAQPRGLPADLPARVPGSIVDRVFYAALPDGPAASVGRPWSAARIAPYELTAGRAPADDNEIVVSTGASPGDRVDVLTSDVSHPYTVVGVTTAGPEPAVFFTDTEAARLAPRVDALATWGSPGDVPTGGPWRVLTGQDRAVVDPTRETDADDRNNTNTIVGIAVGFAAFIAIFVMSSTFALAISQRRREFALLRTIGATPGQVRRMLYAEATVIAVIASALGSLLGPLAAGPILAWLVRLHMAPQWMPLSHSVVPSVIAAASGLIVALLATLVVSWRTGRIPPVEALRNAAVQPRAMNLIRWLLGLGTLAWALITMLVTALADPDSATNRKSYMPVIMLLIVAVAILAPAVVVPVTRLLTAPLRRLRGAGGVLISAGALASVRRTAATAAPVMMAVALTGSLIGASAMTDDAKDAMRVAPVRADYLVLPDGAPGLSAELVRRLGTVPGVDVGTKASTSVYTLEGDTVLIQRPAEAIDPASMSIVYELPPLISGSLADLRDDSIVVGDDYGLAVGDTAQVWLANGEKAALTVAGLISGQAETSAYVTAAHAFSATPSVAYVKLRAGTSAAATLAALRQAAAGQHVRVLTRQDWATGESGQQGSASRLGLFVVLGILLAFLAVAIVNTLLISASQRTGEQMTLRLVGAGTGQVRRYVIGETLLVVAVGVVLAAGATLLSLAGQWVALVRVAGPLPVNLPWATISAVVASCALLAVSAALLGSRTPATAGLGNRRDD